MMNATILGRTAALSLFAMAILAGVGYGYAYPLLINLNGAGINPSAYGIFLSSFFLVLILDVVVAWALYHYFKPLHPAFASLQFVLRLIYASLLGVALSGVVCAASLNVSQYSFITPCLHFFETMWSLALVVFSLHLFVLARLFQLHPKAPRLLSFIIFFAACCYLITNCANLWYPGYAQYKADINLWLSLPMAGGELIFAIWLLGRKAGVAY